MLVESSLVSQGGGTAAAAEALKGRARKADLSAGSQSEPVRTRSRRNFPGLGTRAPEVTGLTQPNQSHTLLAGMVEGVRTNMFMTGADARTAVSTIINAPEHHATRSLREH